MWARSIAVSIDRKQFVSVVDRLLLAIHSKIRDSCLKTAVIGILWGEQKEENGTTRRWEAGKEFFNRKERMRDNPSSGFGVIGRHNKDRQEEQTIHQLPSIKKALRFILSLFILLLVCLYGCVSKSIETEQNKPDSHDSLNTGKERSESESKRQKGVKEKQKGTVCKRKEREKTGKKIIGTKEVTINCEPSVRLLYVCMCLSSSCLLCYCCSASVNKSQLQLLPATKPCCCSWWGKVCYGRRRGRVLSGEWEKSERKDDGRETEGDRELCVPLTSTTVAPVCESKEKK